jgi:D-glycero-D-manno-heptose 1,7-bisphosphate phosphatase
MVILDRDGVINHVEEDEITTVDGWDPIAGSIEAIGRLKKAGYLVTIASNHSGISRGLYSESELQATHDKLNKMLAARGADIDGIYYCPHGPEANCICRKPKPGMLFQIAREFDVDLNETPFVGDNISDIRAAKLANAKPVLVRTGKGEYVMQHFPEALDVPVFDDLAHFVRDLLRRK